MFNDYMTTPTYNPPQMPEVMPARIFTTEETMCCDCVKEKVCKYLREYYDTIAQIRNLEITVPIHIDVKCKEFYSKNSGGLYYPPGVRGNYPNPDEVEVERVSW